MHSILPVEARPHLRGGRRVGHLGTFEGRNLARERGRRPETGSTLCDVAGFAVAFAIVGLMLVLPW